MSLERVLLLIEADCPDHGVTQARLALHARDTANRSLAIELFDTVGGRVHQLLVPMLEGEPGPILAAARTRFGITPASAETRLRQLIIGSDAWHAACALHEAGRRGLSHLTSLVREALDSADVVVREAAMAACFRLLDAQQLTTLTRAEMRADRSPLVRRYVRAQTELLQPGASGDVRG
jgi:hypothetical protein